MFCFFDREACGILAPRPGIKPAPPALEGEVLTTGPPGKSQQLIYKYTYLLNNCINCQLAVHVFFQFPNLEVRIWLA